MRDGNCVMGFVCANLNGFCLFFVANCLLFGIIVEYANLVIAMAMVVSDAYLKGDELESDNEDREDVSGQLPRFRSLKQANRSHRQGLCVCVFPVFHLVYKLLNMYISISFCLIAQKLEVESIVNVLSNHSLAAERM